MKVLLIEDKLGIVKSVSLCLQLRWPNSEIIVSSKGSKGIDILKTTYVDIVILDTKLPDMDGFNVIEQIRSLSKIPIIVLSTKKAQRDLARGLELGADDYITLPFRPRYLVARVNAVLRRYAISKMPKDKITIVRGKLAISLPNNEVTLRNKTTKLTPKEVKLLLTLMENPEHTFTGEKIAQVVWNKEPSETDVVRTYVRRIRAKLSDNPPRIILTDHGEGYKFITPFS